MPPPAAAESAIYIGCMSGTSLDGADCIAARFSDQGPVIEQLAHMHAPYPDDLGDRLRQAALAPTDIDPVCRLDAELGDFYAQTLDRFIRQTGCRRAHIGAIGLHGQTLRHQPGGAPAYSLQIGDAHRVAAACGVSVVADFRQRDLALGGEGAPLTPAFHAYAFRRPGQDTAIVNIGGISNLTLLPGDSRLAVRGYDCGPGNCLIDHLAREDFGLPFDAEGRIAARGKCHFGWVTEVLRRDAFFRRPPPKSTGTDYFSPQWLKLQGIDPSLSPEDRMATITELTAAGIALALSIDTGGLRLRQVHVCGGGAFNEYLMARLRARLPDLPISSTAELGIDPQHVEALAFAWLARQTLLGRTGNLPSVTNARSATVLGCIYPAHENPPEVC